MQNINCIAISLDVGYNFLLTYSKIALQVHYNSTVCLADCCKEAK